MQLFEIYEDDQYFYMVLEFMSGGEVFILNQLFTRIVEKDHYSEEEAAKTIMQIVDALDYCHKKGIVHRDLKVLLINSA